MSLSVSFVLDYNWSVVLSCIVSSILLSKKVFLYLTRKRVALRSTLFKGEEFETFYHTTLPPI